MQIICTQLYGFKYSNLILIIFKKIYSTHRQVCIIKAKEHSLLYYLSLIVGIGQGFLLFPRSLTRNKIQTASSRLWTWITNFISYNDNHYTKCTTNLLNGIVMKNKWATFRMYLYVFTYVIYLYNVLNPSVSSLIIKRIFYITNIQHNLLGWCT